MKSCVDSFYIDYNSNSVRQPNLNYGDNQIDFTIQKKKSGWIFAKNKWIAKACFLFQIHLKMIRNTCQFLSLLKLWFFQHGCLPTRKGQSSRFLWHVLIDPIWCKPYQMTNLFVMQQLIWDEIICLHRHFFHSKLRSFTDLLISMDWYLNSLVILVFIWFQISQKKISSRPKTKTKPFTFHRLCFFLILCWKLLLPPITKRKKSLCELSALKWPYTI